VTEPSDPDDEGRAVPVPADAGAADDVEVEPADEPAETIESYETDDGVVLYDAQNPLAWVEATVALPLRDAV
jgi:hypothetical protein